MINILILLKVKCLIFLYFFNDNMRYIETRLKRALFSLNTAALGALFHKGLRGLQGLRGSKQSIPVFIFLFFYFKNKMKTTVTTVSHVYIPPWNKGGRAKVLREVLRD